MEPLRRERCSATCSCNESTKFSKTCVRTEEERRTWGLLVGVVTPGMVALEASECRRFEDASSGFLSFIVADLLSLEELGVLVAGFFALLLRSRESPEK